MFEQLDQPHQAGREVGVSKNQRKKGRLHCARHGTASQQNEVRSDPNYLVERFLPNSKMLGPNRGLSLSPIGTASHSSGARLYILMVHHLIPCHILDVVSVGLPWFGKDETQLFFFLFQMLSGWRIRPLKQCRDNGRLKI